MKTLVPEDLKLTERTYNNLRKHGAIPEFVDYELPNFITYFTETQDKKKSWQMTVQRWMRSAFKGKAGRDWEYNRHNQQKRMYRNQISRSTDSDNFLEEVEYPRMISNQSTTTTTPMSSEKRLQFADYLSRSMK